MVTADLLPARSARELTAMRRFTKASQVPPSAHVVAIGMFDGFHMGHRQVLTGLRALGERHGLPTLVLTFDPHPRSVVGARAAPPLLCTVDDRLDLLAGSGLVDACLVLPFDEARSTESVESFVSDTLVRALGTKALVVGANFACGYRRRGTVDYLRTLGAEHGFVVHALPLRKMDARDDALTCSSTAIRGLIQKGDMEAAATLLGRPHMTTASALQVSNNRRWGEALLPSSMCLPAPGCYRGAVAGPDIPEQWVPGLLAVEADETGQARLVRYRAHAGVTVPLRGTLRLRFDATAPKTVCGHTASAAAA